MPTKKYLTEVNVIHVQSILLVARYFSKNQF
ncbi:MAG: hypothetical protein ACI9DQ_001732 [Glaciecola sp.]|jgi:hypothetical protein